ncbi:MAG: hypothetical protein LBQ13_04335 [Endomicrobium sp.]|jgi:RecJ-like exonuclease|nr:hypothetical protein [Endomicrobium sp.]
MKDVEITTKEICPICKGDGFIVVDDSAEDFDFKFSNSEGDFSAKCCQACGKTGMVDRVDNIAVEDD